jgi:lysophospholipase L1-like esterase
MRRAMNNQIPFINACLSGDSLGNSQKYRLNLINGCTDVITNMGVNDLVAAASVATVEQNMSTLWQNLSKFGARVWQTTITPKTSSTDTWATTGNQTAFANNSNRTTVNDWIRAGAPLNASLAPVAIGTAGALLAGSSGHPLTGYFETADQVETARNSGIWKVGSVYTTDGNGLHPSSTGAAAMAATINTAYFTP